jgi:cell wall assembly regulator SMI1
MSSFDPARFDAAWKRYVDAATRAHAAFPTYLAPGASEDEVAAAEIAVKCAFPADLRHLLKLHNGSNEHQVLPGWELFPTERIADEWTVWADLYHSEFKPDGFDCEPNGPIRGDEWWRLKWIPFCGDGGGNHLCVDMEPPAKGTLGQVITMWHDDASREVAAPSLTELIELLADDFEAGLLTWDDEMGGVYATQQP